MSDIKNNQLKIKILGNEFVVRQSFGGLILFEEMTGKTSTIITDSVSDASKLFYCFLKAGNRETFNYSYDEFINVLDETEVFEEFVEYLKSLAPANKKLTTKK
ncbi:MAG: hypothetical protein Q8928_02530 [Bacteroidota bacterium]|nr:hypothetical protein [Bacteroidota bacterium]